MIVHLRGELVEKDPTRAVVEAGGVGYEALIPMSTFDRLPRTGAEVKLLVSHIVREDGEFLFGFATEAERDLFGKLVSVSGVGPKIALAILSGAGVGELSLAISSGDAKRLAAFRGVGKKTAEKICVELRDKVDAVGALAAAGRAGDASSAIVRDAVLALGALGFGAEAAGKMVSDVLEADPSVKDVETLVRKALGGGRK